MNKANVKIKIQDKSFLPTYATIYSAGADLKAYIEKNIILKKGKSILIPTGIYLEIPKNFEVQIRPRSGLALKNQITVLNTPGTIDADYRGEVGVILINHSENDFIITRGMKIAQMVICPVFQMEFEIKDELVKTVRGEGGFGHSGTH